MRSSKFEKKYLPKNKFNEMDLFNQLNCRNLRSKYTQSKFKTWVEQELSKYLTLSLKTTKNDEIEGHVTKLSYCIPLKSFKICNLHLFNILLKVKKISFDV